MRVLVENGAVSTHVAGLKVLLGADGSHSTGGQTSRTCADQLSRSADQLQFVTSGGQMELVVE